MTDPKPLHRTEIVVATINVTHYQPAGKDRILVFGNVEANGKPVAFHVTGKGAEQIRSDLDAGRPVVMETSL